MTLCGVVILKKKGTRFNWFIILKIKLLKVNNKMATTNHSSCTGIKFRETSIYLARFIRIFFFVYEILFTVTCFHYKIINVEDIGECS